MLLAKCNSFNLIVNLLVLITYAYCEYVEKECLFERLGVSREAKVDEIKRAYRKKAAVMHPDKNPDNPHATQQFQALTEAYTVLSDTTKRDLYRRCGMDCVKREEAGGGGGHDHADIFASFFGDGFGGFGGFGEERGQRETAKGATITMDLFVTLEELYNGKFVEITRNKPVMKPAQGTRKCNCRQEMVTRSLGPGRFQMIQQTVCDECPNVKMVNEERMLEVEVEIGMVDGQVTTFVAEGEPHMDGEPGDLKLRVRTIPHERFERRGDDLYTNVTISLQDALTGFTVEIPHLDGHTVKVVRDKITWPGARIRKKGEGMPNYENNNTKGVLYITFDVEFPKTELSDEDKDTIRQVLKQNSNNRIYNGIHGA